MRSLTFSPLALILAFVLCSGAWADVIEIFEEDEDFISNLTNEDTPTTAEIDDTDSFEGEVCINITAPAGVTNGQKYNPNIPGWSYKIVEKPSSADEVRWIMFAWKKADGDGIMIQFPDNGAWGVVAAAFVDPPAPGTGRYIAGANMTGWTGIQVSEDAPTDWEYVIRDLYEDFEEFTMTGVALTPFTGIGLYDSIYLAWTQDELERIAKGVIQVEPVSKLSATWGDVKTSD